MFKFLGLGNQDNDESERENRQLRQRCKNVQKEKDGVYQELDEMKNKYITLLEEKSDGFNQYLEYKNLYETSYNTCKEQKREIASLKGERDALKQEIDNKDKEITKLKSKLKKEVQKDGK